MGSIFHNNFLKNSISHFNFFPETDRQTDRPTFGLIEAPLPELKKQERTTFHIEANVEDRQLYRTLQNFIELDRTLYDLPNLIGLY